MYTSSLRIKNINETEKLAKKIADKLTAGEVVFLIGELGAGKTTFTRFLLQALGYSGIVKSPTYSIVESYSVNNKTLHHFDLYRIDNALDLDAMGLRDFFNSQDICIVEWPDKLDGLLLPDWQLQIEYDDSISSSRTIVLTTKKDFL
jgi:tRNA threonylcarbamoyladenosine biosynthesis protein TsaE